MWFYAIRSLLRRPWFTATVVVTVALTIAANVAVFSLVKSVVLQPLPYRQPERLIWLWHSWTGGETGVFSIPDFVEYRQRARTVEDIAAFRLFGVNLTGAGQPERLSALRVSENFFEVLGVPAHRGRVLADQDRERTLAVLGYGLWRRRFGEDPSIVGQAIRLNGEAYTVIGVLAADVLFPLPEAELVVPLAIHSDPYRNEPSLNSLRLVARLRPGVTIPQAKSDLDATTARLRALYPAYNAGKRGVNVVPLHEEIVASYKSMLLLLWCAVGLIILLACANLANLFLTQAAARRKEFAVRTALGAGRGQLVRVLLLESGLLAAAGTALGIVLARQGISTLLRLAPLGMPRAESAGIDAPVLFFALLLSAITALLFGAIPAVRACRSDPSEALQGHTRGGTDATASRSRTRLLASQTALAVMLVVGAGLFLKSFVRLLAVAPGFSMEHLLTARIALPAANYGDARALGRFYDRFLQGLQSLPGVTDAAVVSILPLTGYRSSIAFRIDGRPAPPDNARPQAHYRAVTPGYFRTMGVAVVTGRDFTSLDRQDSVRVAVINQRLADRYFPQGDAVGSTLLFDGGRDLDLRLQVIGIAADLKHRGLDQDVENDIYVSVHQLTPIDVPFMLSSAFVVVRTAGADPLTLVPAFRDRLASADPDAAASQVRSMEQVLAVAVAPRRFNLQLLSLFAVAAVSLAVLGIYGVTSQIALQRRREITIRLALGAAQANVIRLVAMDALKPAAVGLAAGSAVAYAGASFVQRLLYEVSARDLTIFFVAGIGFLAVASLASVLPAIRASRVEPAHALHVESS